MKTVRLSVLLPAIALVIAASPANAGLDSFTILADTQGFNGTTRPFSKFYSAPQINNAGQVAYMATTNQAMFGYHRTLTGTTYDTVTAPSETVNGNFNMNNGGDIVYTEFSGGSNVVKLYQNGASQTIINKTTPGFTQFTQFEAYDINDAGQILFTAQSQVSGRTVIKTGNTYRDIPNLGTPRFNSTGQAVGFVSLPRQPSGFQPALQTVNTDDSTRTLNLPTNSGSGLNFNVNDAGQIAYYYFGDATSGFGGRVSLSTNGVSQGATLASNGQISPSGLGALDIFYTPSLNNFGQTVFMATLAGNNNDSEGFKSGIYAHNGTSLTKVIEIGETLAGRRVTGVHFSENGLNDLGDIAFHVRFADNTRAIIRGRVTGLGAAVVPESTTGLLLAIGGMLLGTSIVARRRTVAIPG